MRERLGFRERFPMPGEGILCCKNNKERGLFNGGMGTLRNLEIRPDGAYRITANIEGNFQKNLLTDPYLFYQHFDNGTSKYDWKKKRPNWFDWSACISVHKAQGSGYQHVTLIDNSSSFREYKNHHLYTGLTRAESGLIVLI